MKYEANVHYEFDIPVEFDSRCFNWSELTKDAKAVAEELLRELKPDFFYPMVSVENIRRKDEG